MNKKDKKVKRISTFPTNIFSIDLKPSSNQTNKLLKKIKDVQKKNKESQHRSNYGGYHSPQLRFDDLVDSPFEFILEEAICLVNDYIIPNYTKIFNGTINIKNIKSLWFIINKKNDYNVVHTHPANWYSGVYYVKVPKDSGNVFFKDPIHERRHEYLSQTTTMVESVNGTLMLFPSWFKHGVEKNLSNKERIAVSFNIKKPRL